MLKIAVCRLLSSFIFKTIAIGNRMNASEISDLQYERYLKILLKLHEPFGEWNLIEFSNITSGVNP